MKRTKLEKYGNENYVNRKKAEETYFEKTGYRNPGLNPDSIKKAKQTKLEKYNDENYVNKEKAKQTNLNKYGVEDAFKSKEVIKKRAKTFKERYSNSLEIHNKRVETCLERYNVPYACMREECRDASKAISKINLHFEELLDKNNIIHLKEFRIKNLSYDFKLNNNIVIEIDPTSYHNINWNPKREPMKLDYHLNKSLLAEENGYFCIHIFDWDDWDKIINLIKDDKEIIYARKCEIKEVSKEDCAEFLNKYHLQGNCKGQDIRLGLYFNNELLEIMTFGKPRYNKNCQYELLRLCSNAKIIGGSEKLFKYFVNNYNPSSIVSYCDKSKFKGDVYQRLGFELKDKGSPRCHWFNIATGEHITDNLLRQRGFDQLFNANYGKGTSNEKLMLQHGFVQVYDCGQATYIWNN